MRLFDLIEEQRTSCRLRDGQAEQADLPEFAAEQQAKAFLRLILRHIEAEEFVVASQVAREGDGEFRFTDASWTEE